MSESFKNQSYWLLSHTYVPTIHVQGGPKSDTLLVFEFPILLGALYSVSQKNPSYGFLKFFSKRLGIFNQFYTPIVGSFLH